MGLEKAIFKAGEFAAAGGIAYGLGEVVKAGAGALGYGMSNPVASFASYLGNGAANIAGSIGSYLFDAGTGIVSQVAGGLYGFAAAHPFVTVGLLGLAAGGLFLPKVRQGYYNVAKYLIGLPLYLGFEVTKAAAKTIYNRLDQAIDYFWMPGRYVRDVGTAVVLSQIYSKDSVPEGESKPIDPSGESSFSERFDRLWAQDKSNFRKRRDGRWNEFIDIWSEFYTNMSNFFASLR